jgi:hypothetical protein
MRSVSGVNQPAANEPGYRATVFLLATSWATFSAFKYVPYAGDQSAILTARWLTGSKPARPPQGSLLSYL